MAPLYTRLLSRALSVAPAWDAPIPDVDRAFAEADLHYWQQYLLQRDSKTWVKRDKVYHVSGDVSGTCYAGYSNLLSNPIVLSYSPLEWDAVQTDPHSLSSVLRETQNAKHVIHKCSLPSWQFMGSLVIAGPHNLVQQHCVCCSSAETCLGRGAVEKLYTLRVPLRCFLA